MVAKRKLLGYTEFATIAQRNNDGKVKITALNSVNKPIKHTIADDTRLIAKTRVEVNEVESNEIDGDLMYSKTICVKQKTKEGDTIESEESDRNEPTKQDNQDWFNKWTKNIIDKILDTNKMQWFAIAIVAVIAGVALGLAL
jgi:hypothetical protein